MATTSTISTGRNSQNLSRMLLPASWPGLEDQTECPVCSDFLIGIIRMCTRGHSFCQKCSAVVTSCPLCRKEMSQVRNYFMEFFMDHCVFKCKYSDQGCSTEVVPNVYHPHTEKCHFREVNCAMVTHDNCDKITHFLDFIPHLKKHHKIRVFKNGIDYCYRFPRDFGKVFQTPYAYIEFDDKTFFYNFATYPLTTDSEKKVTIALWWVSFFNPGTDKSKYMCKIKIASRSDKNLMMAWSGPVLDFRTPAEQVLLEKQCLSSSLPGLKHFCSEDAKHPSFLFAHVENAEIYKLEEPEKLVLSSNSPEVVILSNDDAGGISDEPISAIDQ